MESGGRKPLDEGRASRRCALEADGRGRILVVIPALNEADCIGSVITQARERAATDVVVVDDGSTDDTAAIATL
jgi:cellulose synthase/poly-beta-1,6-N-acetylglucosamine synthase-like glycosyltransferase